MDYYKTKGRIFDIQRFSVHDGPGIRTIIFLKGCVLRCRWCCNPESQNYASEIMTLSGKSKTVGEDVAVEEIMAEAEKDAPYYRRSGGGITLSGGECLCQADFAADILRACKDYGFNTAVESAASIQYSEIKKLLPYLDLFLMDIKHIDSAKHKEFTGKDNSLILENAVKLSNNAEKLIIRVPVIPTFNDTPEEIGAIAGFAAGLHNVNEIHLLPYHRLGQDKYAGLGRVYLMKDIMPPTEAHMNLLKKTAEKTGLKVQIGG